MIKITLLFFIMLSCLRAEEGVISAETLLKGCECVLLREGGGRLSEEEAVLAVGASSYLAGFLDCLAVDQGLSPKITLVDLTKQIPVEILAHELVLHIRETPSLRKD